jgi:hypothetical protein
LIAELIAMFRTDTDTRLRALDDAVVKGDFPLVRKQVHSIKGSASQLGASKVAAICLQIETSGPEVFNQDLPAKLQALRAAYAHITNAMQASPLCVGGA